MSKKGYAIRCWKNTGKGFVIETLNKKSEWCIATNEGSFSTLREARKFFKTATYALRGSSMWIEGPRGGKYGLFERKGR